MSDEKISELPAADADSQIDLCGVQEGETRKVGADALAAQVIRSLGYDPFPLRFGTGSDGDIVLDGTNTYSFLTKSGNDYEYSGFDPLYANNLTISGSARLFLKSAPLIGKGTLTSTTSASPAILAGSFSINQSGGNASGSTGGAAGAQITAGWYGTNLAGSTGASGTTTVGSSSSGTSSTTGMGGKGGAGGNGGAGTSGAGGTGSTLSGTPNVRRVESPSPIVTIPATGGSSFIAIQGGTSGTSGGGGGGNGTNAGGGGGGSGSGGIGGYVAFREVTRMSSGVLIAFDGGNGGNGAPGTASNCGGGGGGSGGGGGWGICVIGQLTGTGNIVIQAKGGGGGNGGNSGGGSGVAGSGAKGGDGGTIIAFTLYDGVAQSVNGSAGGAASGQTGGAGGDCTLTL